MKQLKKSEFTYSCIFICNLVSGFNQCILVSSYKVCTHFLGCLISMKYIITNRNKSFMFEFVMYFGQQVLKLFLNDTSGKNVSIPTDWVKQKGISVIVN